MAKYFLDDQVFDNHSDYAKAVRAKNKQLKEEQTKKIQEDLEKNINALKSQNLDEQKKATQALSNPEVHKTPKVEDVTKQQGSRSGLKGAVDEKVTAVKGEVEQTTTYKQGKTIKEWNDKNKDLNRKRDAIKNTDVLNDDEKKAQLKKIREAKLKATKESAKEGLNNMKVVQRFKSRIEKIKNAIKAHLPFIKWVAIIMAVVTLLWNIGLYIHSVVAVAGQSPHYYCELEADRGMQNSAFYKQYCEGGSLNLEELNGHYMIQDGSGPCTACATMNLYMRYFTANGVNIFDYLWDENGHAKYTTFPENNKNANNWYELISRAQNQVYNQGDNTDGGNTGNRRNMSASNSWYQFALAKGGCGMTDAWGNIPNWGFWYSEDIFADGTYENRKTDSGNAEYTYDIDGYGCLGPGVWARWYANVYANDGMQITIDGVTATMVVKFDHPSVDQLISLLNTHPSGVAFCTMGHGMLFTKYEDGVFYMVDSGRGRAGGFEGPATSGNFCIYASQYSQLINTSDWNGYWYIEEDVSTPTS